MNTNVSRWWFLRLVGMTYVIAFISFRVQAEGLIGASGISPLPDFLTAVKDQVGGQAYRLVPTLCWLDSSDRFVRMLCDSGALAGLLVMTGFLQAVGLIWCFLAYLSIQVAGQQFTGFQWDILLLETGFIAILWAPASVRPRPLQEDLSSQIGRWLVLWLLFRLMFTSGYVKLASGDPAWRSLTALSFHYETQPLPTWPAWFAHHLPLWAHKVSCLVMFAIELGFPWLIVVPHPRARVVAFIAFTGLMALISLTGNYGFFNLLTVLLCLPLLRDDHWPRAIAVLQGSGTPSRNWPVRLIAPFTVIVGLSGLVVACSQTGLLRSWPRPVMALYEQVANLRIVNGYGLFAVMTTERNEITIEGSTDGRHWIAYPFKWKPVAPASRPAFVAPHMPRLDWQMWFAALDTPRRNPWLGGLCIRLLEGEPSVLRLLASDPFSGKPPGSVRATIRRYRFSPSGSADWWVPGPATEYIPPLTLRTR